MVRTADRCVHGLGDHPAGRGQVCRGALQAFSDSCGSSKHLVAGATQRFRAKRPAGKKPAHRTANAVPPILLNSSMSAFIAMVPVTPTPAMPAPASWCIDPASSRNCGLACTILWDQQHRRIERALSCTPHGGSRNQDRQRRRGVQRLGVLHQLHSQLGTELDGYSDAAEMRAG